MNRSISAATETIVYMDGLTAEQKSVLIRLLPYVHSESNLICEDPFELDPTKVVPQRQPNRREGRNQPSQGCRGHHGAR